MGENTALLAATARPGFERALLWKNCLVLRRHAFTSICEIVAVPLVIAVLAGVWSAFPITRVPTTAFTVGEEVSPLTILGARLSMRGQRLAIVGNAPRTGPLLRHLVDSYPSFDGACCFNPARFPALAATNLPALGTVLTTFASNDALEAHIMDTEYGSPGNLIWAAIVVNSWPGVDGLSPVDFSVRFNASECPSTTVEPVNTLAAGVDWGRVISGYITSTPSFGDNLSLQPPDNPVFELPLPGFLSLQLSVDRAAINRSSDVTRLDPNQTLGLLVADLDRCCVAAAAELRSFDKVTSQSDPARGALAAELRSFYRAEVMVPQQVVVTSTPVRSYATNGFFSAMHSFVPLFVVLAYLFPLGRFVRVAVWEKEAGLVDALRAAGVPRSSINWSWPVVYAGVFSIAGLLAAALCALTFFAGGDFSLLLVLFLLYGWCCVAWGMLVVAVFARAKTATLAGVLAWLALAFPFSGVSGISTLPQVKWACSVLAPTALALGLDTLGLMAASGQAPTWATVNVPISGYSVSVCLVGLSVDCILYFTLALYLGEVVAPKADRTAARRWHFPCSYLLRVARTFVCCEARGAASRSGFIHVAQSADGVSSNESQHSAQVLSSVDQIRSVDGVRVPAVQHLEASVFSSDQRVSLRHVSKCYARAASTAAASLGGGRVAAITGRPAVDDVSLDLLPGQVTVLLGHNGAGKTTLVSMMSQELAPTSGSILVWGTDVAARSKGASGLVAVCPQHDPLWPELTVQQHMALFAALKGCGPNASRDCAALLADVGLTAHWQVAQASGELSGGMKRRLCVALALLGDSKLVLLDEPTTGMDPIARAATWLLIRRAARAGRAVVLTTHHLDEADILADRVIIMTQGHVRCAGTLAHLREHFGLGYTLTLALAPGTVAAHALAAVQALVPTAEPPRTRERQQQPQNKLVNHCSAVEANVAVAVPPSGNIPFHVTSQDVVLHVPAGSAGDLPVLCDALDSWSLRANEIFPVQSPSVVRGAVSPPPRIISYAINSLNLGDIFMAVVAEEEEEEERRKGLETVTLTVDSGCSLSACVAAARRLCPRYGRSDAAQRQKLLPNSAASPAAENEISYAESMEILCASRPVLFAGALSYPDRLARHCSALARRRLASYRRDVKTLFIQTVVPAIALVGGLSLLLLIIPGNQPSYQPSTAAFNLQPWQKSAPLSVNVAPYLAYKADGVAESVDMTNVSSILSCIPEANWSVQESPVLRVNESSALPNEFGFFDEAGGLGPPADDLGRLSTSMLRYAPLHSFSVYGAIAFTNNGSLIPRQATGELELSVDGSAEATYTLLVNTTASHSPPLFMSLANSALYHAVANGGGCAVAPATLPFAVRNHPLPLTTAQAQLMKGYNAGSAATLLMIVLCAAPAAIAHAAVRDRETGVRRSMDLAGLSSSAYWLSLWIFDFCTTLLTLSVCLGLFAAFDMAAFASTIAHRLQATVSLMVLYCLTMPPQTYALSFAFTSASSAQMAVFLVNITCVGLMIISMIMGQAAPMAGCDFDAGARYAYRLLPGFCLGNGMYSLSFLSILPSLNSNCMRFHNEIVTAADLAPIDAFALTATGTNLIFLAVLAPIYFMLTLMLDANLHQSFFRFINACCLRKSVHIYRNESALNEDCVLVNPLLPVRAPALGTAPLELIGRDNDAWLQTCDVRKTYPGASKPALDGLSLRVRPGEVIGLLGANGAGKTTAFRLFTGETSPTGGSVWVAGADVTSGQALSAGLVGFVPQVDALMDHLTVGEHVALFARLRCVKAKLVLRAARAACVAVGITPFWDSPAHQLSGGTRRKLSLACAIIGCPPIILLDEFTSGCDAFSRRFLWGTLGALRATVNCAILLSSHHMEDLEGMCSSLAVVAHGRVLAHGSPQVLKDSFCAGYSLEIQLGSSASSAVGSSALQRDVNQAIEGLPQLQARVRSADKTIDSLLISDEALTALVIAAATALVETLGERNNRASMITPISTGWAVHAALKAVLVALTTNSPPPDTAVLAQAVEKWWSEEDKVDALISLLQFELPCAVVSERHSRILRLSLPPTATSGSSTSIGRVFRLMERLREKSTTVATAMAMASPYELTLPVITSFDLSQNSLNFILERMVADAERLSG